MNSSPTQTIQTAVSGLALVELTPADIQAYYDLVDRNRDHLSRHGDYLDLKQATLESVAAALNDPGGRNARFGIWLHGALIGRADLSPRVPGHCVIGYWLGGQYPGHGYMTNACRARIRYRRDPLHATHVFAGVTNGNAASEAVLGRLGFERWQDRGAYTLFRLVL